jgi:hypothetical protein
MSHRFNLNSEFGEHTRPGCCWTRLASSLWRVCRTQSFGNIDASDVFRGGAENSTRGGCAPHQFRSLDLIFEV